MRQHLDYRLEETLYEGPDTRIRRATHSASGERMVVKLPVSDTPSLRTVGRLVHEHQILGKLAEVPGVVRARALTQQSGSAALWLEDPGLRSLDRVLAERGRFPLEAALLVTRAICYVLEGVHAAGVVHKDVKPQNILVDEDCNQAVLVDFGISCELAQEATEASLPEALEGTLAYISPEQTGRTARGLDTRTDLYSLGVTLFEILSGHRPFLQEDPFALVYAHLAMAPPALESLLPEVPSIVARLVERCLEKSPEKRYQTAKGLSADLTRCLQLLKEQGQIEPFILGQKDFSPKLQIPELLISRESELQVMTAAFERAAQGGVEVLLLGGPSGVGKTALVRSVYHDIARAGRGVLLSGKYDQLGRTVPYTALAQAFSGFLRNLAASPKAIFDAWRDRLGRALGPLSRVIADLVPELEWLMGPLPAVPVVSTEMAYNRLKLAWIDFVRAVTDASPPLVLFLDDMQWVDPASLELLKTLLTDVGRKNLLVIAAYRDNEVEPSHPLWTLIDAVEKSGIQTAQRTLGPLSEASVQKWLSVTLSVDPAQVRSLASALSHKTEGNPFFLEQLLLELYRQKQVRRNLEDGRWEWNQDAVERAAVRDNVAELMQSRAMALPQRTQELMGQAACAGHSFSFLELAVLTGLTAAQVLEELRPVLLVGLVIPMDGNYREVQALALGLRNSELNANYRFLHDRVQQAFYERIAPEQRARTHLLIGQRLRAFFELEGGSNQKLLELVRHLNLGAEALAKETERTELARLNLRAAKAAKANGSYRLQAMLVEKAQELVAARAWTEERALSVDLALERIEADFMLREFNDLHRRAEELLARPLPTLSRLAAEALRVRAYLASGKYGEGEQLGFAALAAQGITYPQTSEACNAAISSWIADCDAWVDQHPEGFSLMPIDSSPEQILLDAIETSAATCSGYTGRVDLMTLAMVRHVKQTITRATLTPATPFNISGFAQCRSAYHGDFRTAVRWAREGEQAAIRIASPFFPECACLRACYLPFELPAEQMKEHFLAALRVALASGSFQGTGWGMAGDLYYADLWAGRPLNQIAEKEQANRDMMARAGDALGGHLFILAASYASFLRPPLSGELAADKDWLTASTRFFQAQGDTHMAEYARIQEAHLFLAFEEWSRALERAEEAYHHRSAIGADLPSIHIPLWHGLAAAKCWSPALDPAKRTALLDTLEQSVLRMRYFAEGCAKNFFQMLCLLEAEQARILGNRQEAMALYDEAIASSHTERFLYIEGLAAQFCAEFYLEIGRERIAALYFHQACDAYTRWDALALVSFLKRKYSTLLCNFPAVGMPTDRAQTIVSNSLISTTGGVAIDVNTTIRAAQALARELDPQRVVGQLMRLVQENAGAQRAALLLSVEENLLVSALLSDSQVRTGLSEPLRASHPVAHSAVQYVLRSCEALVLGDAEADARFAADPHIRAAYIRSLLIVPLLHQGRLGGLLYLEHEAANAFPPERVHLLGVLAAQSAIALENARLYSDLQAANTSLETKVKERTAALDMALKELWSEMDLAKKIQTILLPSDPQVLGYEMAAVMRPADQVGGDYYDVFRRGEQDWVLIGDVSGHGVPAGLCMMMIQSVLQAVALTLERSQAPLTPCRLLSLVNEALESNLKRIGRSQYMTITALRIEGDNVLYAGLHQDLLIYRAASQKVERVETQGVWLGVVDGDLGEFLQDDELTLKAGDVLLLYTDGYTEAKVAGGLLGTDELAERFAELCRQALPGTALLTGLLDPLEHAVIHDDLTLVTLRRLSTPAEVA